MILVPVFLGVMMLVTLDPYWSALYTTSSTPIRTSTFGGAPFVRIELANNGTNFSVELVYAPISESCIPIMV